MRQKTRTATSASFAALLIGGFVIFILVLDTDRDVTTRTNGEPTLPDDDPADGEQPRIDPPDPREVYNPVHAGETLPRDFRQVLPRDAIRPIYNPALVDADDVAWDDDTLVLGIEIDGDSVAYPIHTLNRHEIVNDWIGDTPVFASW